MGSPARRNDERIPTATTASSTMYTIYPAATFNSIETAKRAEAINGASERRTVDTICAIEFVDESADGRGELLMMNS